MRRRDAKIDQRLAELRELPINFDDDLQRVSTRDGWTIAVNETPLPPEKPGPPLRDGALERARSILPDYPFADPSILRPHFDPASPLSGRYLLLELRLAGFRIYFGARVVEVIDTTVSNEKRYGWSYRTLAGHIEQGEVTAMVAKDTSTGLLSFRLRRVVRLAPAGNPFLRLGARLLGPTMTRRFIAYAMREFPRMVA